MAETARMTDRFKDGPSPEARAGIKDAARLLRQGVRQAGSRLLGSDTPLPGLRPSGQQPLRRSIEEAAKAADRLITRAETGLRAALLPQDHAGIAAMPPEPLRVVLLGEASEQVANAVTRMMRQWLKAALADLGEKDALVLERPLHLAMRRHRSDQRRRRRAKVARACFCCCSRKIPSAWLDRDGALRGGVIRNSCCSGRLRR